MEGASKCKYRCWKVLLEARRKEEWVCIRIVRIGFIKAFFFPKNFKVITKLSIGYLEDQVLRKDSCIKDGGLRCHKEASVVEIEKVTYTNHYTKPERKRDWPFRSPYPTRKSVLTLSSVDDIAMLCTKMRFDLIHLSWSFSVCCIEDKMKDQVWRQEVMEQSGSLWQWWLRCSAFVQS